MSPAMEVSFPLPSGWKFRSSCDVESVPSPLSRWKFRSRCQCRTQEETERMYNTELRDAHNVHPSHINVALRKADLNSRCTCIMLLTGDRVEQMQQRPQFHLDPHRASCITRDMQIGRRPPLERRFAVAEILQML